MNICVLQVGKGDTERADHIAKNRTTPVIAHRLSNVVDAQQTPVMDKGRIIERGTHRELLMWQGVYAQMWAQQQEER